jgi:hypothetical protein
MAQVESFEVMLSQAYRLRAFLQPLLQLHHPGQLIIPLSSTRSTNAGHGLSSGDVGGIVGGILCALLLVCVTLLFVGAEGVQAPGLLTRSMESGEPKPE